MAIVRQAMVRVNLLMKSISPESGRTLRAVAERLYAERRRRDSSFPSGLFGEPAWDLLLALLIADDDGRDLTLPEACSAARVNRKAGLAVIDRLAAAGLVRQVRARQDRRRSAVALTPAGIDRLNEYLVELI